MSNDMMTIKESDVSTAWAKAFLKVIERGVSELSPLVVAISIDDDPLPERPGIRKSLDDCIDELKSLGDDRLANLQTVKTVANTIFPFSLWNPDAENDAELLFERFNKAWPRLERCKQNRRGSYFRRMTSFRPKANDDVPVNQLKHVIETYRDRDNHRRSALQASIFDPALDHNHSNRGMGFPCLHQVSFVPVGSNGLAVTGYYAMQYIVDRAYGNYLGLCRLGDFMAKQLDLKLTRMTCVASVALRGTPNKGQLGDLAHKLASLLSDIGESSE